jgi:hypothetical protein
MTVQIETIPTLGPVIILTRPRDVGLCETYGKDHSSVKAIAVSKKRLKEPSLADLFWRGEE